MSIVNTFDWPHEFTNTIAQQEIPEYRAWLSNTNIGLETFHAYEEGYLSEIPWALEAYLDHDRCTEGL